MADQRKDAVETLTALLKHARLRWTVLMLASVAGLLAAYATIPPKAVPADQTELLEAIAFLETNGVPDKLADNAFRDWLPVLATEAIGVAESEIRQAGDVIASAGADGRDLQFFTLGSDYSSYSSGIDELSKHQLSRNWQDWTVSDVRYLADVIGGLQTNTNGENPQSSTLQTGDSLIVERVPLYARDRKEVELALAQAANNPSAADGVKAAARALKVIDENLPKLLPAYDQVPAGTVQNLVKIEELMDAGTYERLSAAYTEALASKVAPALTGSSVSAFGLTLSGVALRLLLPFIALLLALDINFTLSKASQWAREAVPVADVLMQTRLFPWIPILALSWTYQRNWVGLFTSFLAGALQISPAIFLLPLALRGPDSGYLETIALACVAGLFATQAYALRQLHALQRSGTGEAKFECELDPLARAVLTSHFERVETAWSTTVTVAAAISAVFIAYLFVPAQLIEDSVKLEVAGITRDALGRAYDQRFRESRDTFASWCEAVCDDFDSLFVLSLNIPEGHPARALVEAAEKQPPLSTYPSALSRIHDLVLESRARLEQFDRQDLGDLVEVMYRETLDPLPEVMLKVAKALDDQPLAPEVRRNLPKFLTGARPGGVTPPMPITYRQRVELGGFADALAPLPRKETIEDFIAYMAARGLDGVASFDHYRKSLTGLYGLLEKMPLKVAGVAFDSTIARPVAPWLVIAAMILLLMRIMVASQAVRTLADRRSTSTLLQATTSSFLNFSGQRRSGVMLLNGALRISLPVLVLLLIALTPDYGKGTFDWAIVACFVGIILAGLITHSRMRLFSLSR